MDERLTQIREGAGLQESRLNQDFIDILQKWSMPVLVLVAVAAVGYAGWDRYQKARSEKIDRAFLDYELAAGSNSPSPDSLRQVAEEFEGVASVPLMARLKAADAYMAAIRAGVKPGAEVKPDGSLANAADAMTAEDRAINLANATALYQRVLDAATASAGKELFQVQALYGLASVAESDKKYDEAKALYERIEKLVGGTQYAVHANIAKDRAATLDELKPDIKLWAAAELPPSADAPPPVVAPVVPPTNPDGTEAPKVDGTPADGTTPGTETPKPAEPAVVDPKAPAPEAPKPAVPKPEEPKPSDPKPSEPAADPKPAPK